MSTQVDSLIAEIEAEERLPSCKHLGHVGYGAHVAILRQDYTKVMDDACNLRRFRIVDSRAQAIELAFDYSLRKAIGTAWERTGEVHIDREKGKMRALCAYVDAVITELPEGSLSA